MPATKRGVYHNLKESKYAVSNGEIAFFFSSRFYMKKFLNEYQSNRNLLYERVKRSIKNLDLNLDMLADIYFYKEIEKRGFYVWKKGVEISWQELREYALEKMMWQNSEDWLEMQKPKLIERLKNME